MLQNICVLSDSYNMFQAWSILLFGVINYLFLKDYVTLEGAISHKVLRTVETSSLLVTCLLSPIAF